jgi:hypothetical protein
MKGKRQSAISASKTRNAIIMFRFGNKDEARTMVVDLAKIERLQKELEEAKAQLWREDAERYRF